MEHHGITWMFAVSKVEFIYEATNMVTEVAIFCI